jgi:hypothetical protein
MPPSIVLGKSHRQPWQQKRAYPYLRITIPSHNVYYVNLKLLRYL